MHRSMRLHAIIRPQKAHQGAFHSWVRIDLVQGRERGQTVVSKLIRLWYFLHLIDDVLMKRRRQRRRLQELSSGITVELTWTTMYPFSKKDFICSSVNNFGSALVSGTGPNKVSKMNFIATQEETLKTKLNPTMKLMWESVCLTLSVSTLRLVGARMGESSSPLGPFVLHARNK